MLGNPPNNKPVVNNLLKLNEMATKKEQAEFNKQAEKYLTSIGAEYTRESSLMKWYKLGTVCGELRIGLDAPDKSQVFSIFCRFEDVNEAKKYLQFDYYGRLNQYSGKWNFHSQNFAGLLRGFENELSPLLLTVTA